jgi:cellulose synthase/poly-beta-1,6-N-acetylglucosamine synthase-like glycosyltransferase
MNAPSRSEARVSVIIPVYGTAAYVAEAIDSVLGQTFPDHEIIVVNDGSPDSELLDRVVEPYRDRLTYIIQENRGASAARNTALRVARGEYVAILDSDDYWSPDYLSSQVSALDADRTVDVVYPDAIVFSPDRKSTRRFSDFFPVRGEVSFLRVLAGKCQIYGGVTARREAFLRAGLYDENLRTGEDLDLWLRILKTGGRIAYNDRALAYCRERPGNLTSNEVTLSRNMLKLLDGLGRKLELSAEERAAVDRQRSSVAAKLSLVEGKQAFLAGDRRTAIAKLTAASKHTRSWKLLAAIASLRIAPGLLLRLYRLRGRWERAG